MKKTDESEEAQIAQREVGAAIVNGTASDLADARVPVADRGFLFGHAVFETLLVLEGKIIGWHDHMARLARGCERTHIRMPDTRTLRDQVRDAVRLNAALRGTVARKVSVRVIVTGGEGTQLTVPRSPEGALGKAGVVILCKDAPPASKALREQGISLATFAEARSMQLVDVKSTNYLWNMLALEHARARGADDAVFVTHEGLLSECTTANFVWVNDERLVCAMPTKDRCLPGTTLLALSRALRKHEHMINDAPLGIARLGEARACLALSSVRGLVPVKTIDGHSFDLEESAGLVDYLNEVLDEELTLSAQEL
jgi:branched-subunit amino acid aminotransferase/4-amino-4-deoxychorismate lyase